MLLSVFSFLILRMIGVLLIRFNLIQAESSDLPGRTLTAVFSRADDRKGPYSKDTMESSNFEFSGQLSDGESICFVIGGIEGHRSGRRFRIVDVPVIPDVPERQYDQAADHGNDGHNQEQVVPEQTSEQV